MPDVTSIIEELERYGVPKGSAYLIAAQLIIIGEKAAVYQRETADALADVLVERAKRRDEVAHIIARNRAA